MGVFDSFVSKKKKHKLGVCIPEHASKKIEAKLKKEVAEAEAVKKAAEIAEKDKLIEKDTPLIEAVPEEPNGSALFEIDGVFQFQESLMVRGKVLRGTITRKSKAVIGRCKIGIDSLQLGTKEVELLQRRENGALHLKQSKGLFLRGGDVIELANAKS